MLLFWGDELICFYNDAFRPSLGVDGKHPAVGKRGQEMWEDIWGFIGPLIEQVMTTGEPVWFEDQLVPFFRNGRIEDIYWTFSYSPAYGDEGQINGVFVTCTETTQKVNTVAKLQYSEQRFQNLLRDASVGIIVLAGEEMRVEVVNDAYARLINRSAAELSGAALFDLIPETEEFFRPLIDQVRRTGEPVFLYDQPYFVYVGDGKKEGFLNLVYQPYKEPDGTITGVMALCQDVTEQVTARRNLEESELFSRNVFFNSPVAKVVFTGEQMVIRTINENMLEMLGRDASVVGLPFMEAMPELMSTSLMDRLRQVFTTGETYFQPEEKLELIRYSQPHIGYYNYIYKALHNTAGTIYGVMVTATEVTEQVLARRQVEEAEAVLRGAIELAELGTWSIDLPSRTLDYSPRLRGWFGIEPDEIITVERAYRPIREADRPLVRNAILHAITPVSDGIYDVEYALDEAQSGQARILHAQGKAYYNEKGEAYKMSGTVQDVTTQRQLQITLEQQVQERTEELESSNEELAATNEELFETNQLLMRSNQNLQQFAYIASHDLQEPLRKIQSFGDMLKKQYEAQLGEGNDYLERMQSAARRMSILIRDLLTYSRISTQKDTQETVSLAHVVNLVLTNLELVIEETGATVQVEPLPAIRGDSLQLEQLFQNLLSNALKFRRSAIKPLIQVSTKTVAVGDLPLSVKTARSAETYLRIDVADNGIGFDEKYADRIFHVFQRLHGKSEFAGTGVGLAICEKVVTNHGGAIIASSQPGQGATFSVYLPLPSRAESANHLIPFH
jgi:PAS domain S-box-containing protein